MEGHLPFFVLSRMYIILSSFCLQATRGVKTRGTFSSHFWMAGPLPTSEFLKMHQTMFHFATALSKAKYKSD